MAPLLFSLIFAIVQVSVESLSGTAQLTWYTSYAPCCPENANYDRNADTTECSQYSACDYSGDFWAIGHKSFNYVQTNNLVAFYDSSDKNGNNFMTNYGGKEIILMKNGITFKALIADSCSDNDCSGCCTTNALPGKWLIDIEYWTAINNFGSIDNIWGDIQFSIGEPSINSPYISTTTNSQYISTTIARSKYSNSTNNIFITNQIDTEQYWIAFYISNQDLSCGGTITNVEITDNNHFLNTWVAYNNNKYEYYSFPNHGYAFTPPISVRITKINNGISESIIAYNLINLSGNEIFNFGSNFCMTDSNHSIATYTSEEPTQPSELRDTGNSAPIELMIVGIVVGFIILIILIIIVVVFICIRRKKMQMERKEMDIQTREMITVYGHSGYTGTQTDIKAQIFVD